MPNADQPSSFARLWRRPDFLLATGAAIVAGLAVGRKVAYLLSRGGMDAVSAAVLIGLTIVGVLVIVCIWLAAARILRLDRRAVGTSIGLATVVLLVSSGGALVTAGFTGGTYIEPVVLSATGTSRSVLTGGDMAPAMQDGGPITCQSEPGTRVVSSVKASDLGAFGTGRLRALFTFSPDGSVDGWAALIDPSGGTADVPPIQWGGRLPTANLNADRTSGRVTFSDVGFDTNVGVPGDLIAPEWPRTISGEIAWQCGPWEE